jgi:hypothetical protein
MKKHKDPSNKYSFSTEFQFEILKFFLQDKESLLVISKVKPSYFALIEHSLIMEAIVKFYRKYKKVPSRPLLIESVKTY